MTRRLISEAFAAEPEKGDLHQQLKAFRETLLPDITPETFADMYAQTIAYGLFASICNIDRPATFARENAADHLPRTNPFLRQLFHHIVGPDLNEKVKWAVEQIVFLLKHADIASILQDFGKRTRQEDPVVHFYETFLAEYDPKLRKSRGVYYTPEPVVSYIVRSVDWLLKEKFNKPDGLADPSVLVLDPACGTGTFLYSVINLISERIREKGQYGAWNTYVRQNLLPRVFGFELLMAPYAVAHLKLGLLLQQTGYDFSGDERLGIYLTNTLEEAAKKSDILFAQWIAEESEAAAAIKKDKPVMVVLGNPPYSKASHNRGLWIDGLMERYKTALRGKEIQIQALSDDYVKFICFAHNRIERTGYGILSFVTNNGYLDGTLHRGLRQELLTSFSDLYVLDLLGDSRKLASAQVDENVFDIQQGVAIGILSMVAGAHGAERIHYGVVPGSRQEKYDHLSSFSAATEEWTIARPPAPYYRFVPGAVKFDAEWNGMHGIDSIFRGALRKGRQLPFFGAGLATRHDLFAVGFDKEQVLKNVERFLDPAASEEELRREFHLCTTAHWSFAKARKELSLTLARQSLRKLLYRPFDWRFTISSPVVLGEMRPEIMSQLDGETNLALLTTRRTTGRPFDNFLVSRDLVEYKAATHDRNTQVFPLYLIGKSASRGLFAGSGVERAANFSTDFVTQVEHGLEVRFIPDGKGDLSQTFGPEDIFDYIYAIFHSPTYRKRYAEFLKIDFPRVPLTSDKELFRKLVALGAELVSLHLMESPKLDKLLTTYPIKGSDTVEKVAFLEKPPPSAKSAQSADKDKGRVYINKEQYFAGIRPEEWEFHIGGYQVLQKWLKDRKGRKLTADDLSHYQRIVVAIRETMRLMAEIDKAIPKWPVE